MEPDVQKTLADLNDALEVSRAAQRGTGTLIAQAQDALAQARAAVDQGLAASDKVNALAATLMHQVSGLVQPTVDLDAMPLTAPAGWKPRLREDFLTNLTKGQVRAFYEKLGWAFYAVDTPDTSTRGVYDPALALSVQDGVLSSRFGFKGAAAPYMPYGTAILPLGWGGQTYGRFGMRFRSDVVLGRKLAWLLWPDPDKGGLWTDGEIDFPEGAAGQNIWGFNHELGKPSLNQMFVDTGVKMTDWHTAVIEWRPERLTFLLDGKVVKETTDRSKIPRVPCRWVLQSETTLSSTGPIPLSSTGAVQIKWLTADTLVAA